MANSKTILVSLCVFTVTACTHASTTNEPVAPKPAEAHAQVIPPTPAPPPASPEPEAKPQSPPQPKEKPVATSPPAATSSPTKAAAPSAPTAVQPGSVTWTMKKGKLQGPGQTTPKFLSKNKDAKTGQVATSTCYKFPDFAIEEVSATGEVGAAEINLRRPTSPGQSLCLPDFKGKTNNLPAIEGFFAGAVGDYAFIEGADLSEGSPDFQIISLKTLKQVFKKHHDPKEEFSVTRHGDKISVIFFAPMAVKCELPVEGGECWKKVLQQNGVTKPAPPPDCKTAFQKSKVAIEEPASVFMRAQIKDIENPKIEFLGGNSVCRPDKG